LLKHLLAGFCIAVVVFLVACGSSTNGSGTELGDSTDSQTPDVSGGTPEQRELVVEVLERMDGSAIEAVIITSPPGCPSDCPDPEHPDETWLEITVRAQEKEGPERVEAYWEGLLAAGAIRDESYVRGLPNVQGKTMTIDYPDGTSEDGAATIISQPLKHDLAPSSAEGTEAAIRDAAKRAQVASDPVTFLEPSGPAAMVTVVSEGDSPLRDGEEFLNELFGSVVTEKNPLVEGIFVEVRDRDGQPVRASAYSVRTGEGVGWIRPDLEDGILGDVVPDEDLGGG
jgi:hypothetical protein